MRPDAAISGRDGATEDRTGLFVVRVWVEGNAATGLRARITHTLDVGSAHQVVVTAASADEVLAAVRTWLVDFLAGYPG